MGARDLQEADLQEAANRVIRRLPFAAQRVVQLRSIVTGAPVKAPPLGPRRKATTSATSDGSISRFIACGATMTSSRHALLRQLVGLGLIGDLRPRRPPRKKPFPHVREARGAYTGFRSMARRRVSVGSMGIWSRHEISGRTT